MKLAGGVVLRLNCFQTKGTTACTFRTLNWVDPFTGEQPGKYGGVKEALGNGYKGENEGRFIIEAQRSSQNIIKLFKIPPREEAGCVSFTANQI